LALALALALALPFAFAFAFEFALAQKKKQANCTQQAASSKQQAGHGTYTRHDDADIGL
jgi:hypothetical protein